MIPQATSPLAIRYPKSRFAMRSVYGFTAASVLTSIIFSLLLFVSIDDDPLMQIMFGSLAVIFELGKFFVWYEVGERLARRHYLATATALLFYAVLAAISIAGSVGGINSATNKAQDEARVQENRVAAYNRQIAAIDQQIALNNEAAQKYIELNRIAIGLSRIQKENSKLHAQQQQLAQERDSLPVTRQGSVLGLIDSLAATLGVNARTAQMGLVIFLSVLLDFFAAFFISLIGEEHRFRKYFYDRRQDMYAQAAEPPKLLTYQQEVATNTDNTEETDTATPATDQHPLHSHILQALERAEVGCSKKAIMAEFEIDQSGVEQVFRQLLAEGRVSQKANKHYRWLG